MVTNDRWGKGTRNTHGGFYSGLDRLFFKTLIMKVLTNIKSIKIQIVFQFL